MKGKTVENALAAQPFEGTSKLLAVVSPAFVKLCSCPTFVACLFCTVHGQIPF
jgi:hypothetical protein